MEQSATLPPPAGGRGENDARARKDVCRTELDLCHARNRNATQEELAALEAKLEYRKYVMEAVEVYGSKGGAVS